MTQGVRDALADAETLRINAQSESCGLMLREAGILARMSVDGAWDLAVERAVAAARTAFRAVPGLRD